MNEENPFLTMSKDDLEKLKEANDQIKQILDNIASLSNETVIVNQYRTVFD